MYVCIVSLFPLKVPRGLQAGGYNSSQPQKCPHYGPVNPNTHHDCHSNTAGPHAEGGVVVKVGHIVDSCSSAHQMSCHSAVRGHWLHGSSESRSQKPMQRHVVTVRCVFSYRHFERCAYTVADGALEMLNSSFKGLFARKTL